MTEYKIVNLSAMLEELGEDAVKAILSDFSCPLNPDVEFGSMSIVGVETK